MKRLFTSTALVGFISSVCHIDMHSSQYELSDEWQENPCVECIFTASALAWFISSVSHIGMHLSRYELADEWQGNQCVKCFFTASALAWFISSVSHISMHYYQYELADEWQENPCVKMLSHIGCIDMLFFSSISALIRAFSNLSAIIWFPPVWLILVNLWLIWVHWYVFFNPVWVHWYGFSPVWVH